MPACGISPGGDGITAFPVNLLLHRRRDDRAILCGQRGHFVPRLGKSLAVCCSADQQATTKANDSKPGVQVVPPDFTARLWQVYLQSALI